MRTCATAPRAGGAIARRRRTSKGKTPSASTTPYPIRDLLLHIPNSPRLAAKQGSSHGLARWRGPAAARTAYPPADRPRRSGRGRGGARPRSPLGRKFARMRLSLQTYRATICIPGRRRRRRGARWSGSGWREKMATAGKAALDRLPDLEADGVTRRSTLKWMALAWIGFGAASAAGLTAAMRFMFPNVLFEPPTRFKAGSPSSYGLGVDERWKENTASGSSATAIRSTRSSRSARISGARPTGSRRSRNSSAPVTGPGTTSRESTSRVPRRGPSSGPRSKSLPTTARSWSTRPFVFSTSVDSGAIRKHSFF